MAAVFEGVDVSTFQGTINWSTLAGEVSFAFIKASGGDGGYYTDSKFSANQSGARAAGMPVGFYHFGGLGYYNTAAVEAAYFLSVVGTINAGEILVLDAESYSGHTLGQGQVSWCLEWLNDVAASAGFNPMIYMNQSTANGLNWSSVAASGYKLWVADYSLPEWNYAVGDFGSYNFLQYSDSESYGGIGHNPVDGDQFLATITDTIADFYTFGKPGSPPPPPTTGQQVGGLATVGPVTYTQASQATLITPDNTYDQILWSQVNGTLTIPNTVGTGSSPYTITTTGISQAGYPIGNFSYDGGASYTDFGYFLGGTLLLGNNFNTPLNYLPNVMIEPTVTPEGVLSFSTTVLTEVGGAGGTLTILYNVAVMAQYNATTIPTNSVTLSQTGAYSNIDLSPGAVTPYATYRRIALDNAETTSGYSVVPHGLGTVPNILFWTEGNGGLLGTTLLNSVVWYASGESSSSGNLGVAMDSTNLYFFLDSSLNAIYYRVYKDN